MDEKGGDPFEFGDEEAGIGFGDLGGDIHALHFTGVGAHDRAGGSVGLGNCDSAIDPQLLLPQEESRRELAEALRRGRMGPIEESKWDYFPYWPATRWQDRLIRRLD